MNRLKIIERSEKAILKQGKPCIDKDGDCQYKLGKLHCGIGVLISKKDFEKNPNMKGDIETIWHKIPQTIKNLRLAVSDIPFLNKLQFCHDIAADIASRELYLTNNENNFNNSFIKEFNARIASLKIDVETGMVEGSIK